MQAYSCENVLIEGVRIRNSPMWVIHPVLSHNVTIGETGSAVDINMQYEEGADGPFVPVVRNIVVEGLTVRQARYAFFIRGLEGAPVRGLVVRDSSFLSVSDGSVLEHVEDLLLERVEIEPSDD